MYFQHAAQDPWQNRVPSGFARGMQYNKYCLGPEMYFLRRTLRD
jgi:hypothetical protein